jgi:hypothetical protein
VCERVERLKGESSSKKGEKDRGRERSPRGERGEREERRGREEERRGKAETMERERVGGELRGRGDRRKEDEKTRDPTHLGANFSLCCVVNLSRPIFAL